MLGALAFRGFARAAWSGATVAAGWRAVALSSLYGATDELHQTLVPDRTATVSDWVTDTAGAIAGVLLCLWVTRLVRDRGKPRGV
jgi:VanZ family protein